MLGLIKTLIAASQFLGSPAPTPAADGPGCIAIIYYETETGSGKFDTHSGEGHNCNWALLDATKRARNFRGDNIVVHEQILCDHYNYSVLMIYLDFANFGQGVCIPDRAAQKRADIAVKEIREELPKLRTSFRCMRPGCE